METWATSIDSLPIPLAAGAGVADKPSIMLLDDDPFMLGMQSLMLRSMGYTQVCSAASAQAALGLLEQRPETIDIVICDLNMPGVDGIEFLRRLDASTFRGGVILLSGEGARIMHTVQKLLGNGHLSIIGALEKPAGRKQLRDLLECWEPNSAPLADRVALSIDRGDVLAAVLKCQWVLHYQPKVNLTTGALAGVEALVRWNHPRHGLVYPDSFIGEAEDCGAIDALTTWVIREALQQLTFWKSQGMSINMAINVSMESLGLSDFARRVVATARERGASARDVTFEITESRLMSPSPTPLENLVRLRLHHFGLSIDDFGTGHSSLAQLRDIPFTELKIDRGFVHGAHRNQIIRPILEASIGIARRLGMQSVAEGVETEDDWRFLREIGCDLAQGYFIARPMAADRLAEWVKSWEVRRARLVDS